LFYILACAILEDQILEVEVKLTLAVAKAS